MMHQMMSRKITYMHQNPVRWGYVDDPEHWRYSSAQYYAGMAVPEGLAGLLEVCIEW